MSLPTLTPLTTLITEIGILIAALTPCVIAIVYLINGIRCLLRDAMLHTYYKNLDSKKIRQYEKENFVLLYQAYKALKGNSFIDDIYTELRAWEVIS